LRANIIVARLKMLGEWDVRIMQELTMPGT